MKKLIMLMIVAIIALATAANAEIINVNMYASSGNPQPYLPQDAATLEGPAGGLGETWNQFNTKSASGLLDSTGAATSVGFVNNVGSGWLRSGGDLTMLLAERALFGKGGDTTHTINGLTAGGLYNVWIASSVTNAYDPEAGHGEWSTSNPTSTAGVQAISNFDLNANTWEYGNNYVLFKNVEADTNGEITFLGDATDAGEIESGLAYRLGLSGFQIETVDMTAPTALAGSDWITWSEKPVTLNDVTVKNNDSGAGVLTLTWSVPDANGVTVGFSDNNAEEPTVTITKYPLTAGVTPVKLTLTVTQAGKDPVESSMVIDVYDDACKAALGGGTATIKSADFNANCVTDLEDLVQMAAEWLMDFSLTDPVDK